MLKTPIKCNKKVKTARNKLLDEQKLYYSGIEIPPIGILEIKKSCWPDLNRWPHPYQGCALPTELQQLICEQDCSCSALFSWALAHGTVGILPQRFLFGKSFFTKCLKKLNNFAKLVFYVDTLTISCYIKQRLWCRTIAFCVTRIGVWLSLARALP